ncbi:MAG: cob(I)yrinic acid a,c-diamide adenosyltransferase [Candidatus Aenigmatarchaeota archaeon]|nr:cob(I)yrinic acid a,c-diamide adenosyltransferase [Candidatus Aenigmarchaeota archaeon]
MSRIYLWTGEGAGKTTSALGVALRALGHGKKVIVIQWLKGRKNIGEYKISKKLKNFKIYQFGQKKFIDLKNPSEKDFKLAKDAINFTIKISKKEKPFLLILDELALAHAIGLVNLQDIKNIISNTSKNTIIYITGRYAKKSLIQLADFVNEIKIIKIPKKLPKAIKGIEY